MYGVFLIIYGAGYVEDRTDMGSTEKDESEFRGRRSRRTKVDADLEVRGSYRMEISM